MFARLARWICAVLVVVALGGARPALAQNEATPEALAAARALFTEGIELEKAGQWEEALAKFEKVAAVKMTPQVRFHIALCHEHLGRLVDAVNGFELAEQEARAAGQRARDVLENAPKRAAALRDRVAHVVLHVDGQVRTSKIYIDSKEVALALVDTSIPVDPGDHVIEVRRDSEVTFTEELSFDEAQTRELNLEINDPEPPPPPPPPTPDPTVEPQPKPPVTVDEGPPQWIAYVVAGAGAAVVGGAGILWLLRQSTLRNISSECEDPGFQNCDPASAGDADLARQYDIGSKVALGVGLAGVATGVALWFILWPDDEPNPASTGASKAQIRVAPSPTGLQIYGRF
jgi:hypothetical protein